MTAVPLTPDHLVYEFRAAGSPTIAPDGSTIVFVLGGMDRESKKATGHLWLIDPDGARMRQLTTVGTTNSSPAWSPDSQAIAFVSEDDGDMPHAIRIIAMAGGESREAARHRNAPSNLAWSLDGKTIAYSLGIDPDNPTEEKDEPEDPPAPRVIRTMQYKEDLRGIQNKVRSHVFLLEVESGTPRQLTTAVADHAQPQWSPDGSRIAVKVVADNILRQRLGIIDVESGETTLIGDPEWNLGTWTWSPDGSFILFDGGADALAQTDYYRYEVASGSLHRLTTDLQFVPEGGFAGFSPASQPVWLANGTALVHGTQAGASGLWTIDPQDGAIVEVARFEAGHSGLSVDTGLRYVVQSYGAPDAQGEIVVYDLESRSSRVITSLNRDLFTRSPAGMTERISVDSEGETIDAWVTFPPDFNEANTYPVVLDVHGGPYGYFGFSFNSTAQMLAAAGMIVVSSNPRGSTSYGRRFAELVNGDWGGGDWQDVQAALDAVLERPYADRDRTGIIGYSYGGFMTSWAIGQTDRFKAAVCGAPVFDLESFYGTSDITHTLGQYSWGGDPPDHRPWMLEHSPSTYIYNAVTPTLIVHGEADVRCPIGQGEEMFAALANKGVEVEFVRYPNSNHSFLHSGPPAYKVDYYTRIRDWFTLRL